MVQVVEPRADTQALHRVERKLRACTYMDEDDAFKWPPHGGHGGTKPVVHVAK